MHARLEINIGAIQAKATFILDCAVCKREMRLVGIETEELGRDLFTFECSECRRIEARSAPLA
jgi:hypothetical protein